MWGSMESCAGLATPLHPHGIMTTAPSTAFDRLAARYDELWTNAGPGRAQREAVWRHVDPLFQPGACILDIGCGTGEDAAHYMSAGLEVSAVDASPEMVRISRGRGVNASVGAIENLDDIPGTYDGAVSNFGALNCVRDLEALQEPLKNLIRPGGHLAVCIIGRFCLRETLHFLRQRQFHKAFRRWSGESQSPSLGLRVFYPTVGGIERALTPEFTLVRTAGIGLSVPPSYITMLESRLATCDAIDRRLAHLPFFRALADHRLLIFVRK